MTSSSLANILYNAPMGIFLFLFMWFLPNFTCLVAIVLTPFVWLIYGRRHVTIMYSVFAKYYWGFMTLLTEKWMMGRIHIGGDPIPLRETVIVMSNHQVGMDWLLTIFPLSMRRGRLGCLRFFAKAIIKYIPGFGTGIYMLGTVFLNRNWTKDKESITKTFENLKSLKLPFWLVTWPEGTRFSPEKLPAAAKFAKSKNLPILKKCLYPRPSGFIATVKSLSDRVDAVYDVTVAYKGGPLHFWHVVGLLFTRAGYDIYLHVRRFDISTLPTEDEELKAWLRNVWIEKDQLLQEWEANGQRWDNCSQEPFKLVDMNLGW